MSNWILMAVKRQLEERSRTDELAEELSKKLRALTKMHAGELERITDAQWEALLGDERKKGME